MTDDEIASSDQTQKAAFGLMAGGLGCMGIGCLVIAIPAVIFLIVVIVGFATAR